MNPSAAFSNLDIASPGTQSSSNALSWPVVDVKRLVYLMITHIIRVNATVPAKGSTTSSMGDVPAMGLLILLAIG